MLGLNSSNGPSVIVPRVHYCHGLESGPAGFKVQALRGWGYDVIAPDMKMSLWSPFAANGVFWQLPGQLISRWPTKWVAGAIAASFEACLEEQRQALSLADGQKPDILNHRHSELRI